MTQSSATRSVLVVDDVDMERMLIVEQIKKGLGLHCIEAESGEAALEALQGLQGECIDLVLLDLYMPGMDGMEVLQRLRVIKPWMPVVILTGSKNVEHAVRAIQSGAVNFLVKPAQEDRLIASVQNALDIGVMRKEISALRERLGVGGSMADLSGLGVSLCDAAGEIKTMATLEVEIAEKVLDYCRGNVSKASKALGLARSTFYRKLGDTVDE